MRLEGLKIPKKKKLLESRFFEEKKGLLGVISGGCPGLFACAVHECHTFENIFVEMGPTRCHTFELVKGLAPENRRKNPDTPPFPHGTLPCP
jgi:hypothetical protein